MTKEVEERILSMKFDNQQFEKNIEKSAESLQALDKVVNETTVDINKSMSKLDFGDKNLTNIQKSLDMISNRFTTMGIVGMSVIHELTSAAIGLGKSLWNSTIGQIKAGGMKRALNIEQASFLLEGLGLDVAQIKEDAMYAVEGTAYGFDEAAKAAASFGASGVKAGEDMKEALLGVSGVAAMTGRDYQNIADIFTTIASNGKLMTMQLRQFSAAGLNVSAALAKYLGKTEQEINEMVTKGQIDFKTFAKAMNETFGEHAKDANKTFTGSMSNMKAALSRIGEAFATPYIENMIPIFNKLKDVINDVKKALSPVIEDFKNLMKIFSNFILNALDKFQNSDAIINIVYGFRHILLGLIGTIFAIRDAFKQAFPEVKSISGAFKDLTANLVPTEDKYNKMVETFTNIFNILKNVYTLVKPIGDFLLNAVVNALPYVSMIFSLLNDGIANIKSFTDSIKDAISLTFEWIRENETLKKALSIAFGALIFFVEMVKEAKIWIEELITAIKTGEGGGFIANLFSNAIGIISKAIDFIKEFITWVDWGKVGAITFALVAIFAIKQVMAMLKIATGNIISFVISIGHNITKMLSNITGLVASISGIFSNFNGLLRNTKYIAFAKVLLNLAGAVLVLALAVKVLSTIDAKDLGKGLIAVAALANILIGTFALIALINSAIPSNPFGIATAMIAVISGLIAITASLVILSLVPRDRLINAVGAIATISLILAIFQSQTRLMAGLSTQGYLTLAATIFVLTICIKKLSEIDFSGILRAVAGMGLMMLLVYKFQEQTRLLTGIDASGYLKLGVILLALTFSIKILSEIPWTSLLKAELGMAGMMILLSEFVNANSMTNTLDTKGYLKLAATTLILTLCIKTLADIPWTSLLKAELGMAALLIIVDQFVNANRMTTSFNPTGFIKLSLTVSILTLCIKLLSDISWGGLLRATLGMAAMLIMIDQFTNANSMISGLNTTGFLKLAVTISAFTLCFKLLSDISWEGIVKATFGMAAMLIMIDQFVNANRMTNSLSADGFIKLAASILIISTAVKVLSQLDPLGAVIGIAAIGSILAMIYKFVEAQQMLNGLKTSGFFMLSVSIAIIASALTLLSLANPESVFASAISLGGVILALTQALNYINRLSIKNAAAFVILSSSLLVISGALAILSLVKWSKALVSAGMLSLCVLALSQVAKNLSFVSMFDATSVVILSSSLILIATALLIIKDVPWYVILEGTVMMTATVIALVGIAAALKNLNISPITAAMLSLLAISLIPVAIALKTLESVNAGQLAAVATTLAVLTLALTGIAAIANLILPGIIGLSALLLAFGAGMLMFAAAIDILVNSFSNLAVSLEELSSLTEETVVKAMENVKLFIAGLGNAALELAAQAPKFGIAIQAIIASIAMAIAASANHIINMFTHIFISIIAAMLNVFPLFLEALGEMLIQVSNWFETHMDEIGAIGYNIGKGLCKGIIGALEGISDAIYEYLDEAFVGSANTQKAAEEAAQQTAATYAANLEKWFNYYDAGTVTADQLIAGLKTGLENGMYSNEEVMRELAQRGLEGYQDELGIHSPSLEMIKNGEYTIAGVIEGIHNGEYTLYEAMEAMGSTAANAFLSQFSGVEGLMGQLNSYASNGMDIVDTGYGPGGTRQTAYRWQAEGYKSLAEYDEAQRTSFMTGKLAAEGYTEATEDAADETENLTDSTDDLTSSMKDYSSSAGSAAKETDKLKDSVKSALDIFSGFDAQLDLTAKDVLRSFSDQLTGVAVWAEELKALAGKGIATELIEELAEAGPKAIDQIHALYSMSSEELALFNQMYGEKLSLEASTADEIRKSFQNGSESIVAGGEAVGEATGNAIAEGTKAGTDQAIQYIEQFVDDGKKATDIIDLGYGPSGTRQTAYRWKQEGYANAEAWEEAHRKACTKMIPKVTQAYDGVAEAASENVKTTISNSTEVAVNEMEQGVKDAYKLGYEFQYVNGVIIPDGIKDSIKEATPGIAAIFGEMGYQSMDAFKHMLNVEDAMTMVAGFQATLEDSITSSLKLFDEVKEKEDISAEEMLHRMKENVKNIGKWANDLQTLAARGISEGLLAELQELGPEGADKVRAFTKMTDEQLKQANQAFAASLELPSQVSDRITKSYAEAGFNTTLGFIDGIDPTAAEEVMTALGTYSLAALQKALDIHSPSKATMELGMYTVAGLVDGIIKGTNDISDAGTEMGSALLESLASAPEVISAKVAEFFNNLGDILLSAASRFKDSDALFAFNTMIIDMLQMSLDDISFEPTITPVLDLSRMDFGALNNALNGFSLTPSLSRANDISGNRSVDYSPLLRDITTQLKETRADVVGIRSDISRLDNAMSNMKVDMDGQSVGRVVTPYINQNLGQSYVNSKRRSMR